MKIAKWIGLGLLTALIGSFAYLAATTPMPTEWQIQHGQKISPNAMHRVAIPPPCIPCVDNYFASIGSEGKLSKVTLTQRDKEILAKNSQGNLFRVRD